MHATTKHKLTDILRYLKRNGKKLLRRYDNVNGIYLDRRRRDNEVVNRFCIVFNVSEKFPIEDVQKKIPKYIDVPGTRDGKKIVYKVPTDVRPVGRPKLQNCLISSRGGLTESKGTITGFFEEDGNRFYVSNMHVLGMSYLSDDEYEAEDDTDEVSISVEGRMSCAFRRGWLADGGEYDVAKCEKLKNHPACEPKDLDAFTLIPEESLQYVMLEPITINCYGHINDTSGEAELVNFVPGPVKFDLEINGTTTVSLTNLLMISPRITDGGDSGALVYDDEDNAYGMIVGADDVNSYAINLHKAMIYLNP